MSRKRQQDFLVSSVNRNIQYYQEMVRRNTNPEQKTYYANLLDREMLWLDYLQAEYSQSENGGEQINTNGFNVSDQDSNSPIISEPIPTEPIPTEPIPTEPTTTEPTTTEPSTTAPIQKVFTLEELASYDGSDGKPAYVAVNGNVYDVSLRPAWSGGTHFSTSAGKDLTIEFQRCHSGVVTPLNRLPRVGILDSKKEEANP